MNKLLGVIGLKKLISLSKKQKFVLATLFLTVLLFLTEIFFDRNFSARVVPSVIYGLLTDIILYFILRKDLKGSLFHILLLFILPFLYTFSLTLSYMILPSRMIFRVIITLLFAFGLYVLLLTYNIYAVSSIRTIALLRSARVVSFLLTVTVFLILSDIIYSVHFPAMIMPLMIFLLIFVTVLVLNFQSLYLSNINNASNGKILLFSSINSFILSEIALVLTIWPIKESMTLISLKPSIFYAVPLTGIFYVFSGLIQTWFEERLFKGIIWEYVWVGFVSVLILLFFSNWGI